MVTDKDVSYVADLAQLELTEDERVRMLKDLNAILGHIDTLNELDTSNVEPMAQVASEGNVTEGSRSHHARRRAASFAAARGSVAQCAGDRRRLLQSPQSDRAVASKQKGHRKSAPLVYLRKLLTALRSTRSCRPSGDATPSPVPWDRERRTRRDRGIRIP